MLDKVRGKWAIIFLVIAFVASIFINSYIKSLKPNFKVPEPGDFYLTNAGVDNKLATIKASDIDKQIEDEYLIYFYSASCKACDSFNKKVEDYQKLDNSFPVYRVSVDHPLEKEFLDRFFINGTPTILKLKDGNEVWRMEGDLPLQAIPQKSVS